MPNTYSYCGRIIKGVVLDITGVLKESGPNGGTAINGSIDAINRLYESGLQFRFCTNETTVTRHHLVNQLRRLGFTIEEDKVFSPIPAVCQILKERNLRPHLLVHKDSLPDFKDVDKNDPNCVVIGDATNEFSYDNLNKAFRCLMEIEQPVLFSLGSGRYYQEDGELVLDVGPYMKALEYATDVKAEVVGKPSLSFFTAVLKDMNVLPNEAVMVGDDIVSDIGGAQACGLAGVLVRTGKFRSRDESHPDVKPDDIVDNLAQFVDKLLQHSL
ncbi:unnamed protein product [Candidula unifasciata]|uniref:Phospholysine phosphohistidine inorganic pyrophosphate phosphatase n=1 Tax=Candidula unifasciata TaxID=100452 RepID=A0A8S4AAI9_9EUPU|nr:unnamed protein product [Candidula unifasciata]